jgi:hypothetical protein
VFWVMLSYTEHVFMENMFKISLSGCFLNEAMDAKQKKGDVRALERRSATYKGPARHALLFDHVQKTVLVG